MNSSFSSEVSLSRHFRYSIVHGESVVNGIHRPYALRHLRAFLPIKNSMQFLSFILKYIAFILKSFNFKMNFFGIFFKFIGMKFL